MGPRVGPPVSRTEGLLSERTLVTCRGELTELRLPLLLNAGTKGVATIPGVSVPVLMSGLLDIEVIFMFLNVASTLQRLDAHPGCP